MRRKKYLKTMSPAKINLALAIGRERPDGYHNITSVFQQISLADELTFERLDNADSIRLTVSGLKAPAGPDNLVFKAAGSLQREFGIKQGVKIGLKKRIPLGAGLGGGSSNAAAAIKALIKLWGIRASREKLAALAAKLGADVPFFLTGGTALVRGKGEVIYQLKGINNAYFVVIVPDFKINTAWAYEILSNKRKKMLKTPKNTTNMHNNMLKNDKKVMKIAKLLNIKAGKGQIKAVSDLLFNSFEEVLFPMLPELSKMKETLIKAGALNAILSGSGSSVFGIFADRASAGKARRTIKRGSKGRKYSVFLAAN